MKAKRHVTSGDKWTPKNVTIKCQSDSCPDGLGLLIFAVHRKIVLCNGSLISPTQVLSAGHCDQLQPGHHGWFVPYSSAQGALQPIPLKETALHVQHRADPKNLSNPIDVAVFTLSEPVTLRPLALARFSDEIPARLIQYNIKPLSQSGWDFQIVTSTCQVQFQNQLAPIPLESRPEAYTVLGCHGEPGDSGSPLTSTANPQAIEAVVSGEKSLLEYPRFLSLRVSNARCLDLSATPKLSGCVNYSAAQTKQYATQAFQAYQQDYFNNWKNHQQWGGGFLWRPRFMKVDSHSYALMPEPRCYVAQSVKTSERLKLSYQLIKEQSSAQRGIYFRAEGEYPIEAQEKAGPDGQRMLQYHLQGPKSLASQLPSAFQQLQNSYFMVNACEAGDF